MLEPRERLIVALDVPSVADADAMARSMLEQVPTIPGCEGAFTEGHGEVVIIAEYRGIILRSMIDWMRSSVASRNNAPIPPRNVPPTRLKAR